MMRINLVGQKFGKVTVQSFHGSTFDRKSLWNCLCDCGTTFVGRTTDLRRGSTKSCGCSFGAVLKRKKGIATNEIDVRFFGQWTALNERCHLPSNKKYIRYGGRGIKVIWTSYDEYKHDMYKEYIEHVAKYGLKNTYIERIDNDGNYCKENCRFATAGEQARNRSITHLITYNGETQCLTDWARQYGLPMKALHSRINQRKWTIERALKTPLLGITK